MVVAEWGQWSSSHRITMRASTQRTSPRVDGKLAAGERARSNAVGREVWSRREGLWSLKTARAESPFTPRATSCARAMRTTQEVAPSQRHKTQPCGRKRRRWCIHHHHHSGLCWVLVSAAILASVPSSMEQCLTSKAIFRCYYCLVGMKCWLSARVALPTHRDQFQTSSAITSRFSK